MLAANASIGRTQAQAALQWYEKACSGLKVHESTLRQLIRIAISISSKNRMSCTSSAPSAVCGRLHLLQDDPPDGWILYWFCTTIMCREVNASCRDLHVSTSLAAGCKHAGGRMQTQAHVAPTCAGETGEQSQALTEKQAERQARPFQGRPFPIAASEPMTNQWVTLEVHCASMVSLANDFPLQGIPTGNIIEQVGSSFDLSQQQSCLACGPKARSFSHATQQRTPEVQILSPAVRHPGGHPGAQGPNDSGPNFYTVMVSLDTMHTGSVDITGYLQRSLSTSYERSRGVRGLQKGLGACLSA